MSTVLVGVLNLTPDSFSDGGRFLEVDDAVAAGLAMVEAGADWIDVGGESTRPGAVPVPLDEEQARVLPVIRALSARLDGRARISIDTYKAGTARTALAAGATVVNDVSGGLLDPEILPVAAAAGATVVLGHLRGEAATMHQQIPFDNVVTEVATELAQRIEAARTAGCKDVWADPGIGFGKGRSQNLAVLNNLSWLHERLGVPLMVGVSRKRFIGDLTGRAPSERTYGTAAAVALAVAQGAAAVRVHDVQAMRDVIRVAEAIAQAEKVD
jgi:dihydropteroate synthase